MSDIPGGYRVSTQQPLDFKTTVLTLAQLLDLGEDDNLAFTYIEQQAFHCIEDNKNYQWREVVGGEIGLMGGNFTYPNGVEDFGIDYSGRSFNFFEIVSNYGVIPYLELRLVTKGAGNTDPNKLNVLEAGDTVHGWKDEDIIWTEARYDGGDPLLRSSYTPLVETSAGNPSPGGTPGTDGADGKSAYEIAVENGFEGSEEEWLLSLEGEDGLNGLSAYQVAVNNGFIGTEPQWLISLKGTNGVNGTNGTNGKSAYQVALDEGYVGTEAQWLASLKGTNGANGKTILSGTTVPSNALGVNGDFYINTALSVLYGPKASGVWGAGTNLKGADGVNGVDASNNLQRDATASFTLADTDNNYVIQLKNGATAITVTVPPTGLRTKFNVGFKLKGTADVTFVGATVGADTSVIINPIGFKGKGQGYSTYIERDGNTQNYDLLGDTKA